MQGIIYKITNKINGKIYIGQTIQSLKNRWYKHCGYSGSKEEQNMAIKKAIHKYGKENFTIEIIESCDANNLNEREIFWIEKYNSYKDGYNSTKGGQLSGRLPKLLKKAEEIIRLYKSGNSLRQISTQFDVDHVTVKHILLINGIELRTRRVYKFDNIKIQEILELINSGVSRKEVQKRYNISKAYLSQLITGKRRI